MNLEEKKKAIKELVKSGIVYLQIWLDVEEGTYLYDYENVFFYFGWLDDTEELKRVFDDQELDEVSEDGHYCVTAFLTFTEEQRTFPEYVDVPAHFELDEYTCIKMIEDDTSIDSLTVLPF